MTGAFETQRNPSVKIKDFSYQPETGFSIDPLPPLDSPGTVVFVFGSPEYIDAPAPLEALRRAYPASLLIGCSTSGEILGQDIHDHSLVVSVVKLESSRAKLVYASIASAEESGQAGERLAKDLLAPDLRGVFVLSDGLKVNGTELAEGINKSLPAGVRVSGGLAGDGSRFEKTWILQDGRPVSGVVAALGLYGDALQIGHGSRGGWDIFGPERKVTRSKGNVLYELDGKPALALYKEYLGHRAAELPSSALLFPLSLRADAHSPKSVVRTILGISEADQSMTFASDIPQGYLAQLMRANFDRLINGAAESAVMSSDGWTAVGAGQDEASPLLAIAISCVGRRLVLGLRAEEETEASLNSFPAATRQIGFYSYGELSPTSPSASCELHNQTMTFTTLRERTQ